MIRFLIMAWAAGWARDVSRKPFSLDWRAASVVLAVAMFAQGQLLGMKSDLLMRLKTEINAWDKVAERHPYSVYRKNEYPRFEQARTSDPFTTNFGDGLPFRTYDRNQAARAAQEMNRTVEQPYPQGYTGHVSRVRHCVGSTYGRTVREAINSVTPSVELVAVKPVETPTSWDCVPDKDRLVSTQREAFPPPQEQLRVMRERVDRAVSTRRPVDNDSRYASSSQLSYQPPPPRCYNTPGWSERPTSNIGQYDPYNHVKEVPVHQATLPRRLSSGTITHHSSSSALLADTSSTAVASK